MTNTSKQEKGLIHDIYNQLIDEQSCYWLDDKKAIQSNLAQRQNVDVLRDIEIFLLRLETVMASSQHTGSVGLDVLNVSLKIELQWLMDRLPYCENWLNHELVLSERVKFFLSSCAEVEKNNNEHGSNLSAQISKWADTLLANKPEQEEISSKSVEWVNKNGLLIPLLLEMQQSLHSDQKLNQLRHLRLEQSDSDFLEIEEYVDKCFDVSSELYLLCMNFGLSSCVIDNNIYPRFVQKERQSLLVVDVLNKSTHEIKSHFLRSFELMSMVIDRFTWQLNAQLDLVGYFYRLDFNPLRGGNYQFTFFFKYISELREREITARLNALWCAIVGEYGRSHNYNPSWVTRAPRGTVGKIKRIDQAHKAKPYNKILQYNAYVGSYLKPKCNGGPAIVFGKVPSLPVDPQLFDIGTDQPQSVFGSRLTLNGVNPKLIWKFAPAITSNPLLKVVLSNESLFQEVASRQYDFTAGGYFLDSAEAACLYKIELFVLLAMQTKDIAIDLTNPIIPKPSQLGRQLIDLENSISRDLIEKVKAHWSRLSIPSMVYFQAYSAFAALKAVAPEQYVTEVVAFIRNFKDVKFTEFLAEVEKTPGYHRDSAFYTKAQSFNGSILAYLKMRCKVNQTVLSAVLEYLKPIFKHDVMLLSARFYIPIKKGIGEIISREVFSELLTLFLRNSGNKKPLSFRHGYIGQWECQTKAALNAHVVFIVDAGKLQLYGQAESVIAEISTDWEQLVREVVDVQSLKSPELERYVKPAFIMHSVTELAKPLVHIQKGEPVLKKIFLNQAVSYFVFSNMFFSLDIIDFPKGLIKGNKGHSVNRKSPEAFARKIGKQVPLDLNDSSEKPTVKRRGKQTTLNFSVIAEDALSAKQAQVFAGSSLESAEMDEKESLAVDSNTSDVLTAAINKNPAESVQMDSKPKKSGQL